MVVDIYIIENKKLKLQTMKKTITKLLMAMALLAVSATTITSLTLQYQVKQSQKELIEEIKHNSEEQSTKDYINYFTKKAVATATEYNDSVMVVGDGNK